MIFLIKAGLELSIRTLPPVKTAGTLVG